MKPYIPHPCHEDWNAMTDSETSEERGRHCDVCSKVVVDFTKMSDAEMIDYLQQHSKQKICGHFSNEQLYQAEKLEINNIDRERSVFLSTGNFPIAYPTTYKTFDKDTFTSSITFSGENNIREVGRSETVLKNIASPYVYLKNYLYILI